jgi:transposase
MLNQEKLVDIHVLHRQGMSIRGIARELNLSRNTVRRYLRDAAKTPVYRQREAESSMLDAFKPYIQERITAAKPYWIPATVLFREVQEQGFQGKVGILRNHIRQFKQPVDEPIVRYETPPGKQLQVDFTTVRRGNCKLKAFVATLGYSRATYVLFSERENAKKTGWLA